MNCANYSVFANEQEVIDNLKKSLEKLSNDAIAAKGKFFVGFSGKFVKAENFIILKINFYPLRWFLGQILVQCDPAAKNSAR